MYAILIREKGDGSVLQLQDAPVPEPSPGEALVRLKAAGVNFSDIYMQRGTTARYPIRYPYIPGREGAGVVETVAPGVTLVKSGDRVAFTGVLGAYAEYIAVNAAQLVPLPDDISFNEGAGLMLQGMTAHYLTHDIYPVKTGDVVLVHAAAGGVGLLCVAMLKHCGARVIGTVSTAEKAAIILTAGADCAVNYAEQDFAALALAFTGGRGVDYIIDGVGNMTFLKNFEAIRERGTICLFGSASGDAPLFPPNGLMAKSVALHGSMLLSYTRTREELLNRAAAVFNGTREGWLPLKIDSVVPLERAGDAHRKLESRRSSGKIIVEIEKE